MGGIRLDTPSQQVRRKSRISEWAQGRAFPRNCPSTLAYVEISSFNTAWLREVKFPRKSISVLMLVLSEIDTETQSKHLEPF